MNTKKRVLSKKQLSQSSSFTSKTTPSKMEKNNNLDEVIAEKDNISKIVGDLVAKYKYAKNLEKNVQKLNAKLLESVNKPLRSIDEKIEKKKSHTTFSTQSQSSLSRTPKLNLNKDPIILSVSEPRSLPSQAPYSTRNVSVPSFPTEAPLHFTPKFDKSQDEEELVSESESVAPNIASSSLFQTTPTPIPSQTIDHLTNTSTPYMKSVGSVPRQLQFISSEQSETNPYEGYAIPYGITYFPRVQGVKGKYVMTFSRTNISFGLHNIRVNGKRFKLTEGLRKLLTSNELPYPLTVEEQNEYISLLKYTGDLIPLELYPQEFSVIQITDKYKKLIEPELTRQYSNITGRGFLRHINNRKLEYVYWDDPNELCERLKLILSAQQNGNTNPELENEIQRIVEELREANIIY